MKHTKILLLIFFSIVFLKSIGQSSNTGMSEMRDQIVSYQEDVGALSRKYTIRESDEYYSRFSQLHNDWLKKLKDLPFNSFSQEGKVDYVLLKNSIEREEDNLQKSKKDFEQIRTSIKFGEKILPLIVQRRKGDVLDGAMTAAAFNNLKKEIKSTQQEIEKLPKYSDRLSAKAAAGVTGYRTAIRDLYKFYNDYDPQFSWWTGQPYVELDTAIGQYIRFLKNWKTIDTSKDDGSGIFGNPIGREEIIRSLEFEMIPYTPEELIE